MVATYQHLLTSISPLLRYQELAHLLGTQVTVASLETLESDIRSALKLPLLENAIWEVKADRFLKGALTKYGLIDASFQVYSTWLGEDFQQGASLLEYLNFKPDETPSNDGLAYTVLESLADELQLGLTWLKLFLRADPPPRLETGHSSQELPADYFPKTFTIEDACLSNSSYVWFWKHFYW
jgi:hypothetical protein